MLKYLETICLICFIFFWVAITASAEKAAELYIPIGQSPGLSDSYNLIGKIDAVDTENQTLTVTGGSGTLTVIITEYTRIFLDKSKLRQSNQYGSFSDLKPSGIIEVRFEAGKNHRPAEWIKLQVGD